MRVKTRRPTAGVRKGLRLIADLLISDFDNAFDRLFSSVSDQDIIYIADAIDWLEQYATEDSDE